jgi:DNA modification methylase
MDFPYEIKHIKLSDLKPHPKNPRIHPEKLITKLTQSINTYGFTNPVLIDADNRVLAGHARCKAAEKMGMESVPSLVLPLTGAAADAYIIADNRLNELSSWDETVLADLVAEIDAANFDVELTGFEPDEIDALLSPKTVVEDKFDKENAKQEIEAQGAVTQRGDIWLLGNHRLMCGDSTSDADFAKLMDGQKAQLCVTSPPYAVGKEYESGSIDDWFATMKPAIKNICRSADTVCYNIGDKFNTGGQFIEPTFAYSIQLFADNGFRPLWVRIWDKKRQALSSQSPYHLATAKPIGDAEYVAAFGGLTETDEDEIDVSEHSFITAFSNSNYRFVKRLSKLERREWGYSSMWRITSVQGKPGKGNHHATFPVELPWRCIKMHSDKGNIVLEPFSGSGTTIIAAEQTERRCYAMELSPVYCDLAVRRWEEFTGEKAVRMEAVL